MAKAIDITGQRFGRLVALRWIPSISGTKQRPMRKWICQCDCGNQASVNAYNLRIGDSVSCGCFSKELNDNFGESRRLSDAQLRHQLQAYKSNSKARNREFSISPDRFAAMVLMNCFYCGSPPSNIGYGHKSGVVPVNGLDRVDNSKGYTEDNAVPCCAMWREVSIETWRERMNPRRSFFKHLIGAGSAVVAAATTESTAVARVEPVIEVKNPRIPDDLTDGQWRIHWSGWKEEAHSETLMAQWTAKTGPDSGAFNNGFHGVVAGVGGVVGDYHYGDFFNTMHLNDYPLIFATTADDVKEKARERAYWNLIQFIGTSPLADRAKCWRCGGCQQKDDLRYAPKDVTDYRQSRSDWETIENRTLDQISKDFFSRG